MVEEETTIVVEDKRQKTEDRRQKLDIGYRVWKMIVD